MLKYWPAGLVQYTAAHPPNDLTAECRLIRIARKSAVRQRPSCGSGGFIHAARYKVCRSLASRNVLLPVIINASCYTENCICILHRYDLLKQSAASTIGIMVEPSVSFMSAFLPKASLLVGLSFAAFYSQQHLKVLGGNLPRRDMNTWKPEHKEAEKRRFLNMVTCYFCFCLGLFGSSTLHSTVSLLISCFRNGRQHLMTQ